MRVIKAKALMVVAAMTLALALPASAMAAGFTAALHVSTHQPRVGRWPITVTADRGHQKLSGVVSYRFLFHGAIVGRRRGRRFTRGVCHDTLLWPASAIGHTITLQVVVATRYGTNYLNWWIRVRR